MRYFLVAINAILVAYLASAAGAPLAVSVAAATVSTVFVMAYHQAIVEDEEARDDHR